jgi:DHA2 family methylenomycin A resistance protein-like MFS transporter
MACGSLTPFDFAMLIVPMLTATSCIAGMMSTMTNKTLSSVEAFRADVASGVLNTARQVSVYAATGMLQ